MKLELGIMAGAESKVWLADLTKIVERMERAADMLAKTDTALEADEREDDAEGLPEVEAEDDEDFAPKKKSASKKAAAAAFDDEDDADAPDVDAEEEETEAPVKKAKVKAPTEKDVNQACKAYATALNAKGKKGVAATKALLLKKFGSESISEIDEDKYAAVIAALKV